MKLRLRDILPNPHRNLALNPLKEDKIQELVESINDTGFWDNVVVRKNDEGKYELAYGHHRLEAAKRSGLKEADFIIKEISNEKMLEMMSRENSETYANDLMSTIESVQAAVSAYAAGTLEHPDRLVPKNNSSQLRYAPFFSVGKHQHFGDSPKYPYSAYTVAKLLGFVHTKKNGYEDVADKVKAAFDFLELQERKLWTSKDVERLRDKETGAIPVNKVLVAVRNAGLRAEMIAKREQDRAEEARQAGEKVKSQLAFLQAEKRVAEQEDEKLLQQQLEANREKNKQWAKETAKKLEEKKEQDADLEIRIKAAKAEEQRLAKERKTDLKQQERDKQRAEERAQTSFLAESKDIRECLDRFLSTECPVYDRLKAWIRNPRVTEELRGLLMLSLRDLSARAADFSPYPVKPTPPKDKQ